MFLLLHSLAHHKKLFITFIIVLVLGVMLSLYFTYGGITEGPSTKIKDTTTIVSSLSDMTSAFQNMKDKGLEINEPLIYAYYFYDHDENKLLAFSKILQNQGFHIGILDKSATYSSDHKYLLYVTESMTHTPQSLLKQCQKLENLAVKNNIEDFDGWEAGKISLDGQSLSDFKD